MLDTKRTTASLIESTHDTISHNYAPRPVVMARGEGVTLIDRDGRRYLDFVAGIAVCCLGHQHPRLVEALRDQVSTLLHVSNIFINEPQALLQERLVSLSFADRIYCCNSGAEANEAAIKLARRYQKKVAGAPERVEIIAATKSFHGRTFAALSATGQPKYWEGFEPMVPGFKHVPYNDLDAIAAAITPTTCAVLLEPVQGEGGIRPASQAYLEGVRALCNDHGVVLIFDEVQCGVGRLGTLWAYDTYGVTPDVVTWAKGIGGGVPLGIMASNEKVAAGFTRGSHATTYGGNPLACRAGLTVLEVVAESGFLQQVQRVGDYFRAQLEGLAQRVDVIREIRGKGLMLGAEVGPELARVIPGLAREEGLLINTAGGDTLRFVPPLIIREEHVDEAIDKLTRALTRAQNT